ncbi:alpha/beta fold hydrolase [Microbacterium sp. P5_E9]
MAEIEINGGRVVYELVGPEDGEVVTLTPGGRFSKDYGGVHELANALAAGGKRVLLWDRPNCGASDIQIYGKTESHMRAEILGELVRALGIPSLAVLGGSGGARDSILFTIMNPDLATRLCIWSIVGGTFSTMSLAGVYVLKELRAVWSGGIDAVAQLPEWSRLIATNPRNRERLDAIGGEEFERVMSRWFDAYVPKPNEVIPGVPDWQFADVRVPTLIIRGGEKDRDHPKRTSFEVHALIKGSTLIDPPWPEDAWERAVEAMMAGTGSVFDPWVQAAPAILAFLDETAPERELIGASSAHGGQRA